MTTLPEALAQAEQQRGTTAARRIRPQRYTHRRVLMAARDTLLRAEACATGRTYGQLLDATEQDGRLLLTDGSRLVLDSTYWYHLIPNGPSMPTQEQS